jgi:hypothetical protein
MCFTPKELKLFANFQLLFYHFMKTTEVLVSSFKCLQRLFLPKTEKRTYKFRTKLNNVSPSDVLIFSILSVQTLEQFMSGASFHNVTYDLYNLICISQAMASIWYSRRLKRGQAFVVLSDQFTRPLPYISSNVGDNNPNYLFGPKYHNKFKTIA